MKDLEAKEFLVQQVAEQAALEHVPLSDLEKRMMYFTESEEMREDAIKLNDEFEEQHATNEYEPKISELFRHARARIQKENPATAEQWKSAIKQLSKGDHYILVLGGEYGGERPPYDSLKLLGTALLLAALFVAAVFIAAHYGIDLGSHRKGAPPATQRSLPPWLQQTLIALLVAGYAYFVIVPWLWKKSPPGLNQRLSRVFGTRNTWFRK